MASAWRAAREWVVAGEEEDFVTPDRLVASLGAGVTVPVVECRGGEEGGEGGGYGEEARREGMTLGEYAALWRSGQAQAQGLYLKDFHFLLLPLAQSTSAEPGDSSSPSCYYSVPPPLGDDWLNEWWDATNPGRSQPDDYRFLYLGPAGSVTPMHHDVVASFSWSANLAGRKRWRLFQPRHTPRLFHHADGAAPAAAPTLVADADSPLLAGGCGGVSSSVYNRKRRPRKKETLHIPHHTTPHSGVPRLEVEQGPGQIIFIPSGWHHTVENLTGCLSLNTNWFNGSALGRVWAFLKDEDAAVRARLRHLEPTFEAEAEGTGWARQCEAVLRANAAMNLTDWAGLLVGKAERLAQQLQQEEDEQQQQRRRRDLGRVVAVLRELREDARLLDSLFPPHLEARLGQEEEEDAWPPPPPPPQEALRPLVVAWLDAAVAVGEAALLRDRGGGGGGGGGGGSGIACEMHPEQTIK